MLAFDTLKYANTLKASGIPAEQAEAQAYALAEVLTESVVTKTDFKDMKTDVANQIQDLKFDIDHRFGDIRSDIDHRFSDMKTDIDHRFKSVDLKFSTIDERFTHIDKRFDILTNNIRWGAGLILTYMTLIMSLIQFFKH